MKRLERRRKFHEDIINMLYPPQSSSDEEEKEEKASTVCEKLDVNLIRDPEDANENTGTASSSGNDDHNEGGSQNKLSRAQRKRIRRKKLKEAASRRRKFIGPMLPSDNRNDGRGSAGCEGSLQGVRQSDAEEQRSGDNRYQVKVEGCGYDVETGAEAVRRNVSNEQYMLARTNLESQDMDTQKHNRLKQRRMAKKLAKDCSKSFYDEQAKRE